MNEQDLPKGWEWCTIGEICTVNPKVDVRSLPDDIEVSFVPMKNVAELSGVIDVSHYRPLHEVRKGYTAFKDGDVLVAKITPCMENGKVAIAHGLQNGLGFGSTEFHVLRPDSRILAGYLFHYVVREEFRHEAQQNMTGTAGQLRVPTAFWGTATIPVPPLSVQHDILKKLDELFSRLDAGVAALQAARTQLKQYRQSVLKAAVEGRLTERWRTEHAHELEPASTLLERILAERRAHWEGEELAKMAAKGKTPKDDSWKKKYKEPAAPDTTDLPELPEGWCVAGMDQLTTKITSGSRDWTKYYDRGSGTFIMAQNVRMGELDLSYRQAVDPPQDDRDRLRSEVEKGDLLVTIVGANTGDVCRVPEELHEYYVCQSVALMRPVLAEMSEYLVAYMISSENGQRQYKRYIYGAGRPHLSFDQLKMTAIALPPAKEQTQIVNELSWRMSIIDHMEREIEEGFQQVKTLRQSILKRAFEGKLVGRDVGTAALTA